MSADKLVDSTQLDADLTSVANAIRTKGGTSASLAFPADFVSAIQAIPTGITPTGTKQISIAQNGTVIEDVASYANAEIISNVPTVLKIGVIRPDAELVQTWTYDKLIHEDEGVTIPAYTTTDTTLKSWGALTPTVTIDRDNYYWFAQCRGLAIPIYSSTTVGAGRQEYSFSTMQEQIIILPAQSAVAIVNSTKNAAWNVSLARDGSYNRNVYWSNASTLAYDVGKYGAYLDFTVDVALGSTVVTARQPYLKIRGHATYFNSTYWALLTDIRYQYIIELYRVPKGSLNLGGWNTYMQMNHVLDCVATPTHKLT